MKIYFCIILAVLVSSCTHYVVNDAGYIRPPKSQKFSYKKKSASLNFALIDTNSIYYSSNGYFYKNDKGSKLSDKYIRFYGDGRFKLQGLKKSPPELADINNPDVGVVGYYITQGNAVKMQIYTDIDAGSIQLEYGYIDENGTLIVMHDNPRVDFNIGYNEKKIRRLIDKSPFSPEIYKNTPITGLTYLAPNW